MSETPATEQHPDATPDADSKPSGAPQKTIKPELRDKLRQRKPIRDYGYWIILSTISFLGFMLMYFVYTQIKTTQDVHSVVIYEKPPIYPVDRLLSATDVKLLDKDGGFADITYGFAAIAANRIQLDKVLKDWRGARNNLDRVRAGLPDHEPIQLDAGSGLPMTPLLSVVSFDGNLDFTVRFKAAHKAYLWFFFHYIYDYEVTGTALTVSPDGVAQFVRYRRELTFDDPQGEPGQFEVKPGSQHSVRIVVREFPLRAGFQCVAYDGEREITRADFAPEWGADRRYHPADIGRRLVADFPNPPQAGYLAFVSDPPRALHLAEVQVKGTVAEAWRIERTKARMILEELLKPAKEEGAKDEPASERRSEDLEPADTENNRLPAEKD